MIGSLRKGWELLGEGNALPSGRGGTVKTVVAKTTKIKGDIGLICSKIDDKINGA